MQLSAIICALMATVVSGGRAYAQYPGVGGLGGPLGGGFGGGPLGGFGGGFGGGLGLGGLGSPLLHEQRFLTRNFIGGGIYGPSAALIIGAPLLPPAAPLAIPAAPLLAAPAPIIQSAPLIASPLYSGLGGFGGGFGGGGNSLALLSLLARGDDRRKRR